MGKVVRSPSPSLNSVSGSEHSYRSDDDQLFWLSLGYSSKIQDGCSKIRNDQDTDTDNSLSSDSYTPKVASKLKQHAVLENINGYNSHGSQSSHQEKANLEKARKTQSRDISPPLGQGGSGSEAEVQKLKDSINEVLKLAYQLRSQNMSDRITAATSLARKSSLDKMPANVLKVVSDSLGKAVKDQHYKVRAASACALSILGDMAVTHLGVLGTLIDDTRPEVRAAAALTLGRVACDQPNVAKYALALRDLLQDKHHKVRGAAANGIGFIGLSDPQLAQALASACVDEDATVRAQAAYALGKLGDAAIPHCASLVSMLKDENIKVRESAIHTLGKCGGATRPFIQVLADALHESESSLRQAAANALGNLGEVAQPAAAELASALKDESKRVRVSAALALGKLNAAATPYISVLKELKHDSHANVRNAAMCALAKLDRDVQAMDSKSKRVVITSL